MAVSSLLKAAGSLVTIDMINKLFILLKHWQHKLVSL